MHCFLRKCTTIVLCGFLLLSEAHAVFAATFPDVTNPWYTNEVEELVRRNILTGYADGTFKPEQPVNRAEFLKVLMAGGGHVTAPEVQCFPDVPLEAWYAPYVCEAMRKGLVKGYPNGSFKPESVVNMAEALAMTMRVFTIPVTEKKGEDWFEPYETEADDRGILPKDAFLPSQNMSRQRMALVVSRAIQIRDNPRQRSTGWASPGCSQRAPATPPSTAMVNNVERSFLLYVPEDYSPRDPLPLIVALHGRTNNNAQVRKYFGLEERGGTNAIIVYPQALGVGSYSWAGDITYFDVLVHQLADQYCIDMSDISLVGHSLGGWFTNTLACARGDVIRASSVVAGSTTIAKCAGPVAGMFFHHPADQLVTFAQGLQSRDQRIEQNNCSDKAVPVQIGAYDCQKYLGCRSGNPVIWCELPDGFGFNPSDNPHTWPKYGGQAIWDFFRTL